MPVGDEHVVGARVAPQHRGRNVVLRAVSLRPREKRAEQRYGRRPRGHVEPLVVAHLRERCLRGRLGGPEAELSGVEGMEAGEQGTELPAERPALLVGEPAGRRAGEPLHDEERALVDADREHARDGQAVAVEGAQHVVLLLPVRPGEDTGGGGPAEDELDELAARRPRVDEPRLLAVADGAADEIDGLESGVDMGAEDRGDILEVHATAPVGRVNVKSARAAPRQSRAMTSAIGTAVPTPAIPTRGATTAPIRN